LCSSSGSLRERYESRRRLKENFIRFQLRIFDRDNYALGRLHSTGMVIPVAGKSTIHSAMSLYQRILGHPFVFNRIRPVFVGGIDWKPLYEALDAGPDSVVLDVGWGPGIAPNNLEGFREITGF